MFRSLPKEIGIELDDARKISMQTTVYKLLREIAEGLQIHVFLCVCSIVSFIIEVYLTSAK